MIRTQENGGKPHFGLGLSRLESNLGRQFFFHGQLSSSTISEKTNDKILRKFSDGRTDERE